MARGGARSLRLGRTFGGFCTCRGRALERVGRGGRRTRGDDAWRRLFGVFCQENFDVVEFLHSPDRRVDRRRPGKLLGHAGGSLGKGKYADSVEKKTRSSLSKSKI